MTVCTVGATSHVPNSGVHSCECCVTTFFSLFGPQLLHNILNVSIFVAAFGNDLGSFEQTIFTPLQTFTSLPDSAALVAEFCFADTPEA